MATKGDIAYFIKEIDFNNKIKNLNKKVTSNKSKHLLIENELKKLQTFDSNLFIGQNYFNNNRAQLYLIFQPIYKTITAFFALTGTISEWDCQMKNSRVLV